MFWGVYPRLCTPWAVGGFEWILCAKCLLVANMGQMQKSSAKSVILPHKHRINNVPGRKGSFSQHTVGLFPWAHCKPTNADDWWASNVTQTHLEEVWGKEEKKIKNNSARKKNVRCFLASYNASFMSMRWFVEWVDINRPPSGSWFIASWVWSNYKPENIHKECFIIMGHSVKMNVSLITSIKTRYCQCVRVYHIGFFAGNTAN